MAGEGPHSEAAGMRLAARMRRRFGRLRSSLMGLLQVLQRHGMQAGGRDSAGDRAIRMDQGLVPGSSVGAVSRVVLSRYEDKISLLKRMLYCLLPGCPPSDKPSVPI